MPQRAVLDVLDACGRAGIRAALIISAGFGEAGEPGRAGARGNLALVSQSGAMAFASILSSPCDRGVGFATVVSSGNEAVVDTVDYLRPGRFRVLEQSRVPVFASPDQCFNHELGVEPSAESPRRSRTRSAS